MNRPASHPRRRPSATRRRTSSAAALALLALGALSGCGSDEAEPSSADPTATSTPSESVESPTEEPDEPVDGDPAAGDEVDPADFVDLYAAAFEKASTTRMAMTFGGALEIRAEGVADFSSSPPRLKISMQNPASRQDMTMVLSDEVMYVQVAPEQWVRYDLSDPTGPMAGLTGQLDPSAMIETFGEGVTAATYVGEEEVSGETMEHYRIEVDTAAMLEGTDTPPGAGLPEATTFEIWFDGDGLFRRMSADLGPTAGTFEATYDDWGEPVDITVPPKSQVMDLERPIEPQA